MPDKQFLSIKVNRAIYELIRKYQGPRETYSHVLERAFDAWEIIDKIKRGEWPPQIKEPVKTGEGEHEHVP